MGIKGLFAGAAVVAVLLSGSAASADVCSSTGCGVSGADGSVPLSPSGNTSYQYITTSGGTVNVGDIASVGNGNTPQNQIADGTLLTTSAFSAAAGSSLSFYFDFITSDGYAGDRAYTDYAWAELETSTGTHVAWLFTAETQPSGFTSPASGAGFPSNDAMLDPANAPITAGAPTWSPLGIYSGQCFGAGCGTTGWIQSTYTIGAAGDYQLQFGVTNWADSSYDSGLAFDAIKVTPPGGEVPEPGTVAVMLMGVVFLYAMLRRRETKS